MRAEVRPRVPQQHAPSIGQQSGPDVGKALFAEEPHFRPAPDGLVQARKGDPLFDDLAWGYANGTYPYQKTIAGRSGPRVHVDGRELLMLSSYDYLGLVGHPHIQAAAMHALRTHGTSSGGVRLLTGTAAVHRDLDLALARFKGTEAAVSFGSTYLTNLGVVSSLFGPRDVVFVDRLAHRSIIDACLLARVRLHSFPHGNASELRRLLKERARGRRALVIVEGVYSMDGDCCPLPEIVEAAKGHGAFVMVDEAHSFGVLGATGRGVDEHFGMSPSDVDIWVGALSKAIPSNGGFVAGSRELVLYLQHRAGPFVFSSALNPPAAGAALASLEVIEAEPWRIAAAHSNAKLLREGLAKLGWNSGASSTPIVPVRVGEERAAHELAAQLHRRGVLVTPVVFPAVPRGEARLRLCVSAAHSEQDIQEALEAFREVALEHHNGA